MSLNIYSVVIVFFILFETVWSETKDQTKSSDFSEVVKSPFFVDKTLLLKDMFLEMFTDAESTNISSPVVTVRAGSHSGKTTNNNMIKTFLEISVDDQGNQINKTLSDNYNIFKSNKLKIFHDNFFNEHFAKYPVINIQCKLLSEATNLIHFYQLYRKILLNTFLEHEYLLRVDTLWSEFFDKSNFELYLNERTNIKLEHYSLYCGFSILSKVLHKHFGKNVFILIDDFNSFDDSPAYETGDNKNRIIYFINEVNEDILKSNKYLQGALLTGSLDSKGKDRLYFGRSSSELWKYYGLSNEELSQLLEKHITGKDQIKEAASVIYERFSGHQSYERPQPCHPCSVWSVIRYIEQRRGSSTQS